MGRVAGLPPRRGGLGAAPPQVAGDRLCGAAAPAGLLPRALLRALHQGRRRAGARLPEAGDGVERAVPRLNRRGAAAMPLDGQRPCLGGWAVRYVVAS